MAVTEAERAMLLAGLHDVRLPPQAAGGALADLAAALAVGLLLALILAPLARMATRVRPPRPAGGVAGRMAALAALSDEARRLRLLRLLAEVNPEAVAALGDAPYRPDGLPSAPALEAELRKAAP